VDFTAKSHHLGCKSFELYFEFKLKRCIKKI